MKRFLFGALFSLAFIDATQATVLNGASCEIEAVVKEVSSEKKQICGEGGKNCREYDSPYVVVNIQSINQITNCSFLKVGDDFKLDSGGDLSLLAVGDKLEAGTEVASSMTISGVSSFIQWSNIKIIQGDKTLPDNYGLQGDAAPIKAIK